MLSITSNIALTRYVT